MPAVKNVDGAGVSLQLSMLLCFFQESLDYGPLKMVLTSVSIEGSC